MIGQTYVKLGPSHVRSSRIWVKMGKSWGHIVWVGSNSCNVELGQAHYKKKIAFTYNKNSQVMTKISG